MGAVLGVSAFRYLPFAIFCYASPALSVLFVMSRREQHRKRFSPAELVILVIAVAGFVTGVVALATGAITI
jgi:arginine:ornithine antiporter/lysine permease